MATVTTTYRWVPGARIRGNADAIGTRLEELSGVNGERLTPRMVVDDARAEESPLHPCFEWDDVRAGELFREAQARLVIRSIRLVTSETGDDAVRDTSVRRAYVNLKEAVGDDMQNAYVPLTRVLGSEELRRQLIVQARSELVTFKRRYMEIVELVDIVDDALAKVQQSLLPDEAAA